MTQNIRNIKTIIDHGGPLLLWFDTDSKASYKKGFIIDIYFCDNPECKYGHFNCVEIDDRMENFQFLGKTFTFDFKNGVDKTTMPKTLIQLEGNIHIQTEEIKVQNENKLSKDESEFLSRISQELQQSEFIDTMRKRFRHAKGINKDKWKKEDWSWWKPGQLVRWLDIHPDAPVSVLQCQNKQYFYDDMYCVTPGCNCKEVCIAFVDLKKSKDIGFLMVHSKKWTVENISCSKKNHRTISDLWHLLNEREPDLQQEILNRRRQLKKIGKEIARLSLNIPIKDKKKSKQKIQDIKKTQKVERNAPCPCGSGKKYKKCCMN
ncbi:MAG: SEC-C domain-containing protein [Candidatus Magnetomorum sp.]|nr:SEC-C domain-containing protein [Candidatus Magnetomorum sp.]